MTTDDQLNEMFGDDEAPTPGAPGGSAPSKLDGLKEEIIREGNRTISRDRLP